MAKVPSSARWLKPEGFVALRIETDLLNLLQKQKNAELRELVAKIQVISAQSFAAEPEVGE